MPPPSEFKSDVGKRLRSAREEAGLTQEEAAETIGVSRHNLSAWERGVSQPMSDKLPPAAALYGVSTDWILGRESDLETIMSEPELALRASRDDLSPGALKEIADLIRWKRQQARRQRDEGEPGG